MRIAFVVAGVVGMLLIVQPGSDVSAARRCSRWSAAAFYAPYQIMTRMMSDEDPRVLAVLPGAGRLRVDDAAAAVRSTARPTCRGSTSHARVCGGLLGTFGHFLFILAFQRAPASALTPFTYMQLVWAMLLGLVVFGTFPTARRSPAWRSSPAAGS